MRIRRAVRLAWEGKKLRRPKWDIGLHCVNEGRDIVFYSESGELQEDCYLDINDLMAEDWQVVE